ncbi:Y+L amino acid transporter 2-like isoform X2 [Amphibalanus amphitrite]|uniref:Y+L amino acid transporter 2-like isoform X2 n=1 Tax=Amphibalanus amphitrite TaxID=1232801 RepID=UPI001C9286A3|nr:Y+L amino acid transporter 2-like isoform X2 [Amphibalanus amphitrite]
MDKEDLAKEGGGAADKKDDDSKGVKLQAKMSLLNGITVIVGSIIGSGIFISPTGVLENTGSINLSLVVWVASGVFSMVGAYCYAELGCMINKSGADYAYIMDTFGPFLAFMRLWVECMIVRPCSQTVVALTFSVYALKPFYPTCEPPYTSAALLAAVSICVLTFVNCYSVTWATRVQDIFTFAKLLALVIIIITGIYMLALGETANFTWDNTQTDVTKIALSFYSGLFAYNGWNYLNFIIEELKDPVRNLPRAIAISIILVTLVYVLTNIAFYTTLSPMEVLSSNAVAVSFAQVHYGYMAWIIPMFVAMSTFGGLNGILLTSSRLFYAGAREGQMPEILTMIQVNRLTPAPAVLFVALLSLVYLTSSDIFALINYVGFATWLSIGAGVLCLPVLRWTQPNLVRPIRVNLFWPIIYIIATIFITIMPMIAKPVETGFGLIIILSGVPVYLVCIAWKKKPAVINKSIGSNRRRVDSERTLLTEPRFYKSGAFTRLLQKVLVVLPENQ